MVSRDGGGAYVEMFGVRRRDPLQDVNLLELAPVRLADWEDADDRVVLIRPTPRDRGVRGVVRRLLNQAATQRIRLDPIGAAAWLALDGTRSVTEVAELLRAEFGERVEPAEQRVGALVQMLRREGFLGYPGFDVTD